MEKNYGLQEHENREQLLKVNLPDAAAKNGLKLCIIVNFQALGVHFVLLFTSPTK